MFLEIQLTGNFRVLWVWAESKQSKKKKGIKNQSTSIALEILLLGLLSSRITRKMKYKAQSIHTRIDYCISLLPDRGLKELDKIKIKAKRQ